MKVDVNDTLVIFQETYKTNKTKIEDLSYYQILGFDNTQDILINRDSLKDNFRRIAKLCHPDLKADDAFAKAWFIRLSAANKILTDDRKRQLYDLGLLDVNSSFDCIELSEAEEIFLADILDILEGSIVRGDIYSMRTSKLYIHTILEGLRDDYISSQTKCEVQLGDNINIIKDLQIFLGFNLKKEGLDIVKMAFLQKESLLRADTANLEKEIVNFRNCVRLAEEHLVFFSEV